MDRAMLGITLKDRLGNEELRRRTKVDDIVQQIAIKKDDRQVMLPETTQNG